MKFAIFLKSGLLFNSFFCLFWISKTLRLSYLKTWTVVNAKISVLCVLKRLYSCYYVICMTLPNSFYAYISLYIHKTPPALQGFIEAFLMTSRQHKRLSLLIQFSKSIFMKFYFNTVLGSSVAHPEFILILSLYFL